MAQEQKKFGQQLSMCGLLKRWRTAFEEVDEQKMVRSNLGQHAGSSADSADIGIEEGRGQEQQL